MRFLIASLALFVIFNIYAQDETLMPVIQKAQSGLSISSQDLGMLENSVNLVSGEVTFPFSLVSGSSGGVPMNVSLAYSSEVERRATRLNEETPDGVAGMGWSFGYSTISVDNKMTGTRHDDQFYLDGEPLVCTDNNVDGYVMANGSTVNNVWAFRTNNTYSPYTYYFIGSRERWEVKMEGMTYVYGGKTNFPTAVQWIIHWDNWIGDSNQGSNQDQQAVVWNLAQVKDQWGNEVEYKYMNINQKVHASSTKVHTEASYLQYIEGSDGSKIELAYGNKQAYEFHHPHDEENEPDAYQERYEQKYLSSVKVFNRQGNLHQLISLGYTLMNFDGTSNNDTKKRVLTSVKHINKVGHASNPTQFTYNTSGGATGKLYSVKSPGGALAYYTYSAVNIAVNDQLYIGRPNYDESGWTNPKVWSSAQYTVVAWWKNGSAKFFVYWWDGEWREKELFTVSDVTVSDYWDDNNMARYSNIEIQLRGDHFSLIRHKSGRGDYYRGWFDHDINDWTSYTTGKNYYSGDDNLRLFTGEKFSGFIGVGDGEMVIFTRDSDGDWTGHSENYPDAHFQVTAANNYILIHSTYGDPDKLYLHWLDEVGTWHEMEDNAGLNTPGISGLSANNFSTLGIMAGNQGYIYDWPEDYSNVSNTYVGTMEPSGSGTEIISSGNNLYFAIAPPNSENKRAHWIFAYDGSTWDSFFDKLKMRDRTISQNAAFFQRKDDGRLYTHIYDPNEHDIYRYISSGALSNNRVMSLGLGVIAGGYVYRRRNDTGYSDFGGLYSKSASQITSPDDAMTGGSNYITTVYNGDVYIGRYINGSFFGTGTSMLVKTNWSTGGSQYETTMYGPTSFVLCNDDLLKNSYQLMIYKVNDGKAGLESSGINDYPVTQVKINDGIRDTYTSYAYDHGELSASGSAVYERVTVYPHSSNATSVSGYVRHYYYPGSDPYYTTPDYYNEDDYYSLLRGLQHKQQVYGKYNNLLSEENYGYEVSFDGMRKKIQMKRTSQNNQGVVSDIYNYFNTHNQVNKVTTTNRDANGNVDNIEKHTKYIWEAYNSEPDGLYGTAVQTKTKVNSSLKSSSATHWKQWSGKWAPEKQFVWNGGSENFTFSGSTPSGWILTNTVSSRNAEGQPTQTLDMDGIVSSVIYGGESSVPLMSAYNAGSNELLFDDFNQDGDGNIDFVQTLNIEDGHLSFGTSGTFRGMFLHTENPNARADFKFRLSSGSGYAAFKFNASISTPSSTDGNTVRIYGNGNIQLYYGSTLKGTYSYSGDLTRWHTMSIRRTSTVMEIFIDNEKLISVSYSGSFSSSYYGFYSYNMGVDFDHLRLYPADAYASSTSYHPATLQPLERMDKNGLVTRTFYNNWGAPVANIDDEGKPMSTTHGASALKYGSSFSTSNPGRVNKTVVAGSEGLADDFEDGGLDGWFVRNASGSSTWTINGVDDGGYLQHDVAYPSVGSDHGFFIDLGYSVSGRISFEFDVWSDVIESGNSIGFAAGGSNWGYDDDFSESNGAVLFTTCNGTSFKAKNSSGWSTVHSSLDFDDKAYRIKITLNTADDRVTYYIDGREHYTHLISNVSGGIRRFGFKDLGGAIYPNTWYVDNFVMYQDGMESITFFDAAGKPLQSMSEAPDNKLVMSEPIYNSLGQTIASALPTTIAPAGESSYLSRKFDASFIGSFNESNGQLSGDIYAANGNNYYAYSSQKLELSPLARPLESGGPGSNYSAYTTSGHTSNMTYTTNSTTSSSEYYMGSSGTYPANSYMATKSEGPDGSSAAHNVNFYDQLGNLVMSKVGPTTVAVGGESGYDYQTGQYLKTRYEYDDAGNLTKIYPPNYYHNPGSGSASDYITTMAYDNLGRMTSKTTPDNGTTEYIYDNVGRVKFSRDAAGTVFYNKYDAFGRVTESGHCTNTWGTLTPTTTPFNTSTGWRIKTYYDDLGRVWKLEYNNDNYSDTETKEEYTYDKYNRITQVKQYVYDYTSTVQTVSYEYDNLGNIVKEDYGGGFIVRYHYNKEDGSLKSIGDNSDADHFASYTYDQNGRIKTETLNGTFVRTYNYDASGKLIEITDPYFEEDLLYESGGYGGDGNHAGMISRATYTFKTGGYWHVTKPNNYSYLYRYDELYRLTVADYSLSTTNDLGVGSELTFDANGNLARLKRHTSTYNYTYYTGKNQVQNMDGSGNDYTYDALGNVELATPKSLTDIDYDVYFNKVSSIDRPGSVDGYETTFHYGAGGERVLKKDYMNYLGTWNKTMYTFGLNDFPIKTTSKTNNTGNDVTYYVYGPTGLIAMKKGYELYFALKDHQGSTRVIIDHYEEVVSYFNYQPYGGVINSGVTEDVAYRFTGHEYDEETGLHNFRARMFDEDLGRFYGYDPAEQYASPYVGLGNSPVMGKDPDGELFKGLSLLVSLVRDTRKAINEDCLCHLNPFKGGTNTHQWLKITRGKFKTDEGRDPLSRAGELLFRFSPMGQPLSFMGSQYAYAAHMIGDTERVTYFHGTTVLWDAERTGNGAGTFGHYIHIEAFDNPNDRRNRDYRPGYDGQFDPLMIHEYGHYVQYKRYGSGMTFLGGVNSAISFTWHQRRHEETWWERDASAKGWDYMVGNGFVNPRTPSASGFANIQLEYDDEHPRRDARWWQLATLPVTFPWYFGW